jgi:hypothetical protein
LHGFSPVFVKYTNHAITGFEVNPKGQYQSSNAKPHKPGAGRTNWGHSQPDGRCSGLLEKTLEGLLCKAFFAAIV